ncbi:ATP-binding protein [Sphingomonas sp.]|uniref:ATP-binding protein n=1 Tax=Sphingomonas sp. TaxID=28214 RepID=UPI003B00162F
MLSATGAGGATIDTDFAAGQLQLSATQITTLALVGNELATNAIKHAFEEGKSGHIRVAIDRNSGRAVIIIVDDDGLPFPDATDSGDGLRLGLSRRLVASIGGLFIPPQPGSKAFELRVPVASDYGQPEPSAVGKLMQGLSWFREALA